MTSIRAVVLGTLVSMLVATPAIAKEKKPAKSNASKSTASRSTSWTEKSDPKGFTIKVPGEATEKRDEWSTSYAVLLAGDAVKLNAVVKVETLDELTPVNSLDKAVEAAVALRPRGAPQANITEQKEIPNGYLVIIGPEYDTYAVDVTRNGKEVQLKAHCTGPATHLKELKEMCLSVKATK